MSKTALCTVLLIAVAPLLRAADAPDTSTWVKFTSFNYSGKAVVTPGSGDYANPIIAGFYPDPSICRVGEDYYLVNLAGCEVLGVGQVFSPVIQDNRKHDAVSLLIRYQGQPLVLAYLNWAKTGEPNSVEVMLENLYSDPDHFELCDWAFPNTTSCATANSSSNG